MKKLAYILIILGLLYCFFSCSASWHVQRAVKKDPSILKEKVDTFRVVTREIIGSATGTDSVVIDNDWVYIKSKVVDHAIEVEWDVKSYSFDTIFRSKIIELYDTIIVKKTRREIRYEARQARLETKEKAHTTRVEIRRGSKVEAIKERYKGKKDIKSKTPLKRFWSILTICFWSFLSFVIGLFIGKHLNIFKA